MGCYIQIRKAQAQASVAYAKENEYNVPDFYQTQNTTVKYYRRATIPVMALSWILFSPWCIKRNKSESANTWLKTNQTPPYHVYQHMNVATQGNYCNNLQIMLKICRHASVMSRGKYIISNLITTPTHAKWPFIRCDKRQHCMFCVFCLYSLLCIAYYTEWPRIMCICVLLYVLEYVCVLGASIFVLWVSL